MFGEHIATHKAAAQPAPRLSGTRGGVAACSLLHHGGTAHTRSPAHFIPEGLTTRGRGT